MTEKILNLFVARYWCQFRCWLHHRHVHIMLSSVYVAAWKSCSLAKQYVPFILCLLVILLISYYCFEGILLVLIVPSPGHCLHLILECKICCRLIARDATSEQETKSRITNKYTDHI